MSREFDLKYDNVSSKSAPALDDYEKSVFLTNGMYKLLDISKSNLVKEGMTVPSEITKKLKKSYETTSQVGESATRKKIVSNAVFYTRASDIYHIELEQAKLNSDDPYLNGWVAKVIPVPYDRVLRVLKNPFLGPERDRILRIDSGLEGSSDIIQLIPPKNATINTYSLQYIKKPYPIILSDLSLYFPGDNYSIYGKTLPYSDEEATDVSEIVHRQIVDAAVDLAILHYRENSLSNNLQIK